MSIHPTPPPFPPSFARHGSKYYATGKLGTTHATGRPSAEYEEHLNGFKTGHVVWLEENGDAAEQE